MTSVASPSSRHSSASARSPLSFRSFIRRSRLQGLVLEGVRQLVGEDELLARPCASRSPRALVRPASAPSAAPRDDEEPPRLRVVERDDLGGVEVDEPVEQVGRLLDEAERDERPERVVGGTPGRPRRPSRAGPSSAPPRRSRSAGTARSNLRPRTSSTSRATSATRAGSRAVAPRQQARPARASAAARGAGSSRRMAG